MAKDKRIHTGRWTKLAKQILIRDNYECAIDGCDATATTADHIKPSSKFPDLFWEEDNLVAMCAHHNYSKQAKIAGEQRITWFNPEWFTKETIEELSK